MSIIYRKDKKDNNYVNLSGKLLIIVFFIFNIVYLPSPLLWINILSVLYVFKVINSKYFLLFIAYLFLLLIFSGVHLYNGVDDFESYQKSTLLYILVAFTAIATRLYLIKYTFKFEAFYRLIVKYNFILFIVGLTLFFLEIPSTIIIIYDYDGVGLPRMRGLLYEPSYYALILTPWVIFAILKNIQKKANKSDIKYFLLLMIPFLATVSIGVITALGIALGIVGALRALSSMKLNRKVVLIITSIFLVLAAVVALNAEVIFTRVIAILTGEDGSTNMRTIGSMDVAYQIMKEKSTWFGIGPGQIKITGKEIFNSYFNYQDSNVPRIPNAIGETMTTFGFIGLAIRLIIQFLIFIQFRVYKNNYLLSLFLFLFIYQFTGSFITSTIEYVFWLLLTIPVFKEFKHD